MTNRPIRIGLSSCFFHADQKRPIFKGKTLLYLEESMAHWISSSGALAYMIPTRVAPHSLKALAQDLDALVLQGGSDVSPKSYGEVPLKPEWAGDYTRDQYELDLIHHFRELKKPILGICRGAQIINVAFGGTLYQDIETQVAESLHHRDWEMYEANTHKIRILPETGLSHLYPGLKTAKINSVHHQAINRIGLGLMVEAKSAVDDIIEAVRFSGKDSYIFAVQWHPEFQRDDDPTLLHRRPILNDFLEAIHAQRH